MVGHSQAEQLPIESWVEESSGDDFDDQVSDEPESDTSVIHSPHDTDTEMKFSDETGPNDVPTCSALYEPKRGVYIGKDLKTRWMVQKPPGKARVTTKSWNGGDSVIKHAKQPVECISLFLDDEILEKIVASTNMYIIKLKEKFSRDRDCKLTDREEIKALIGVLYMAGIKKISDLNIKELWLDDSTTRDFFKATMSIKRFSFLLRVLRFDDINSRKERKKIDNLAPIREIFERFVAHCKESYIPGDYCAVNQILEPFRGRCKFKVCLGNKPAKYGIKMFTLINTKSFYTINLEIYAGKQPAGPYNVSNSTADVVKRIADPILNTGRNITMDSNFASVPFFDELKNVYNTTAVGTLQKSEKEIPLEFLSTKDRAMPCTLFGFGENKLMLSYMPKTKKKTKKLVVMLSSLHDDVKIDETSGNEAKAEIVTFYNSKMAAVAAVDMLKEKYSVSRITSRWPMRLFFSLLNIAGINGQVIYKVNTDTTLPRPTFLKQVALELVKPHMLRRISMQNVPSDLKFIMNRFVPTSSAESEPARKGFCAVCPRKKNRRSKKACTLCRKVLCTEHVTFICQMCYENVRDT